MPAVLEDSRTRSARSHAAPIGPTRDQALSKFLDAAGLPTPPGLAMQVVQATSRSDCTAAEIASLLGQDPALCGSLLKTVNSCIYGFRQPVTTVERAVVALGLTPVRSLVLSMSLTALRVPDVPAEELRDFWQSSLTGALIARELGAAARRPGLEDLLVAGLLRDLGALLIQRHEPKAWKELARRKVDSPFDSACELEVEAFGIDHADLSAELLLTWGLPADVVEPVRFHHRPAEIASIDRVHRSRAEILHLAEALTQLDAIVNQPDALVRMLEMAESSFGLTQTQLTGLLGGVVPKINEFVEILNLNIGRSPDFARILTDGCAELVKMTVSGEAALTGRDNRPAAPRPAANDATCYFVINPASSPSAAVGPAAPVGPPAFRPEFIKEFPTGGCTLDGYTLRAVLGQGGMGVVFRAYEPSLDRDVAIKMILSTDASDAAARFAREARTAAAIRHENVVTVYAVRSTAEVTYLAMEFVQGQSLQDLIGTGRPLSIPDVVSYGRQAAAGLAAAHARGIVHRDIKPANLLVESATQKVKITDFGLARGNTDAQLTQAGALLGTPLFMAPEQVGGAESVGPAADLFSLGSVLYALCTGASPFDHPNVLQVLQNVGAAKPVPVQKVRPDVPKWLNDVILRLLSKRPEDRYASAAEVEEVLAEGDADLNPKSSFWRRIWVRK